MLLLKLAVVKTCPHQVDLRMCFCEADCAKGLLSCLRSLSMLAQSYNALQNLKSVCCHILSSAHLSLLTKSVCFAGMSRNARILAMEGHQKACAM